MESIKPAEHTVEAVQRHRSSIESALAGRMAVAAVRRIGSHARGTAVEGASDADYLVVLRRDEVRWGDGEKSSDAVLRKVKAAMEERYGRTEIARDGQAIRVRFRDGDVDVVPALYDGPAPDSGHPVFHIPDGSGWWMRTSPDAHQKHLREANDRAGGRLNEATRTLKAFRGRTQAGVPLKSLYVEMVLAEARVAEGVGKPYTQVLRDGLRALDDNRCPPIDDPTGVGDPIHAAATTAQREAARISLARARERGDRAVEAEQRGNHREALRLWGLVFNQDI